MVKATRILVANRPKLMRDVILTTLADQPDIEIVGEVSDEAEILSRVEATLPDLVVVALEEAERRPAICDRVLREHPGMRIIAVASREDRSIYYWASFDIHSNDIEASADGILSAVRNSARAKGSPEGQRQ
jgi:chemotaxis response regulator CheB